MTNQHLVSHIHHSELVNDSTLHVIRCVSNPVRYHSRYRLAREQEVELLKTQNVILYTVESAFGDRHHEVTIGSDPHHLQVRTNSEIWVKENLLNLGVRHLLPPNWKYMAWVDADVLWRDSGWALETIHQLQHFPVVQPWASCADLGYRGEIKTHFDSFGYVHQQGITKQRWTGEPYKYAHSGFAWACTRSFWENTRGLFDCAPLGSADHHMAWAMIGEVDTTIHKKMGAPFFRRCMEWQEAAVRITKKQVGFTPGRIEHFWHGPKAKRKYRERWQILIKHQFNPDTDLMYDAQGVLQLVGKPGLEHDIKLYNRDRHEDSISEF